MSGEKRWHMSALTCENGGTKIGPGNRVRSSVRALTPEAESEALMSISPYPCAARQGVGHE